MKKEDLLEKCVRVLRSCKTRGQYLVYEKWKSLLFSYLDDNSIDSTDIRRALVIEERKQKSLLVW